ncbi:MAG: amidase family protein, partial [Actinomycetota bacterium]|nr:amidase family protein [Actinomycetota bacterium]
MDIPELQRRRASGEFTAAELAHAHLDRVRRFDGKVNAVLVSAVDAVTQAEASDRRARDGGLLSPLDGVTVLLK